MKLGQSGRKLPKNNSYTVVIVPNGTGPTRRLNVPRSLVTGSLLGAFCIAGAFAAFFLSYIKMRSYAVDYERLRAENSSIRSEAAALASKLTDVQETLQRVDQFSDQLREAATIDTLTKSLQKSDGRKNKRPQRPVQKEEEKSSSQIDFQNLPRNIGPLTREEFALAKQQGLLDEQFSPAVKVENLEFKSLFKALAHIEKKSGTQAEDLEKLLADVQQYQRRLAATPLIAPVRGYLTSQYGWRRSPFNGQSRMHHGVDIAAPMGSPIYSAADGVISKVAYADDFGRYVEVLHGHGIVTRYAHAQRILVKKGEKVKRGKVIGLVGMTGRTTGPHLHYEILVNGARVDPMNFIKTW